MVYLPRTEEISSTMLREKSKEEIKSGVIGEIVDVDASELKLWGVRFTHELDAEQAGGSMYELGFYPLLPIIKLMG